MNKKMKELLAKIESKTILAKSYMEDGEGKDVEKATAIIKEIDDLQREYDTEQKLYELSKKDNGSKVTELGTKAKTDSDPIDSTKAFADMARSGFKTKGMSENVDEDGGYIVPEDIQTRINQYRDAEFSLLSLVDCEKVSTNKGARTYQKKSDVTGFAEFEEGGEISELATPKFERITYNIKDYGGFMPVPNNLLSDSDANITNTLTKWIGINSMATANRLILAVLAAKGETAIDGIKGIKGVLNKTLGQAYKNTSAIVTNDDGLDWLDNLEDKNGRPLLNPDPTDSAKLQLRCGATIVPIKVIPNKTLKSNGTKIPMIIGDLKEAVKYWDRQQTSIKTSDVASIGEYNAFAQNSTLFRAIEREDVTAKDSDAFVYGYINLGE